ncbi:MAG TPA: XdhC family protein, partial [Longimicrobium sp.]|nr:XdhC family protein [Longimicrobium sp.]
VEPDLSLLICGGGTDAVPLARLAAGLGWRVTVADHRPLVLGRGEFAPARMVDCPDPYRLGEQVVLSPRTCAVVMSHDRARDSGYLGALLSAGVGYVGLLGPRARADRLLGDHSCSAAFAWTVFGPAGLDLGGEGPEAIAVSIVAEILAVTRGRSGGHLRDRAGPIHDRAATARVGRTP